MIFIWGNGGNRAIAGDAGEHTCSHCNNVTRFSAIVDYRYFHFWYLFSFLTSRNYAIVCNECGNGSYLTRTEFKKIAAKDNIPLIRKWGWLICALIIAGLIGHARYNGQQNLNTFNSYILHPQVDDVYFADLAKLDGSGYENEKHAYGTMKLIKIEQNHYLFVIADTAYTKKKGVPEQLSTIDYLNKEEDTIALTDQDILSLKNNNIIYSIFRQ